MPFELEAHRISVHGAPTINRETNLTFIDKALSELGEPDRINDPFELNGNLEQFEPCTKLPSLQDVIEAASQLSLDEYKEAAKAVGGH